MTVSTVLNRVRKSMLYIKYSKRKMSYYNFQNAFVNPRNMVYLVNKLSTETECVGIDNCISIMGNEFNFDKFVKPNDNDIVKFKIYQDEFENYKVLFYRKSVEGSNVISQLHLFNDELLYARVTFDYLGVGNNFRKSIMSEIRGKYHLYKGMLKDKNVILKDPNGNRLKIIDNGKIVLQYISGNKSLLRKFYYEASMERDYALEDDRRRSIIASFI